MFLLFFSSVGGPFWPGSDKNRPARTKWSLLGHFGLKNAPVPITHRAKHAVYASKVTISDGSMTPQIEAPLRELLLAGQVRQDL